MQISKEMLPAHYALIEERMKNSIRLTFAKVLAHINNSKEFPLPTDKKSLEWAIYQYYEIIPKKKQKDFFVDAGEILSQGDSKRKENFGDLIQIDFKSKKSVIEQIKSLKIPDHIKVKDEDQQRMLKFITKQPTERIIKGKATKTPIAQPQGLQPRTLSLSAKSITCIKTNDLHKDEISLGGIVIDALGRFTVLNNISVGKFKKGDTINVSTNGKLFDFDLREAGVFPQSFLASLFLIDKDLVRGQGEADRLFLLIGSIGAAIIAIGITIFVVGLVVPGVVVALAGMFINFFGATIYTTALVGQNLIADDFSERKDDAFIFNVPPVIPVGGGEDRTITFNFNENIKGSYSGKFRWERTE